MRVLSVCGCHRLRRIFGTSTRDAGKDADAQQHQTNHGDILTRHVRRHERPSDSTDEECGAEQINEEGHDELRD